MAPPRTGTAQQALPHAPLLLSTDSALVQFPLLTHKTAQLKGLQISGMSSRQRFKSGSFGCHFESFKPFVFSFVNPLSQACGSPDATDSNRHVGADEI